MLSQFDLRPVIKTGSSHSSIVQTKARHAHDVQWDISRRAQASNVSRVGRYLWFDKCNTKHKTPRGGL